MAINATANCVLPTAASLSVNGLAPIHWKPNTAYTDTKVATKSNTARRCSCGVVGSASIGSLNLLYPKLVGAFFGPRADNNDISGAARQRGLRVGFFSRATALPAQVSDAIYIGLVVRV